MRRSLLVIAALLVSLLLLSYLSVKTPLRNQTNVQSSRIQALRDEHDSNFVRKGYGAANIRPPFEHAALSRSIFLMEFPNPAVTNIATILDTYAASGWMKTYALNDACMFSVLFSQLHNWQQSSKFEDTRLTSTFSKEGAGEFEQTTLRDFQSDLQKEWTSLEQYYLLVCSNHFAIHYNIFDKSFTDALQRIEFSQTIPNFRSD